MRKILIDNFWGLVSLQMKEKCRKPIFLWTLLLLAGLTFFYFPANNQSFTSLTTVIHSSSLNGSFRGVYNSAWMGLLVVLFLHTTLIFAGPYFIRNPIKKDIDSRMDIFIKSSPVSMYRYLESKRISNFLYLLFLVGAVEVMAVFMQLSRGESNQLIFSSYIMPFLLIVVPFVYVISSLAVCLDLFRIFRNTFGNILLFFAAMSYMSYVMAGISNEKINPYFDFTGIIYISHNIFTQFVQKMNMSGWDGGLSILETINHFDNTFVMNKVSWNTNFIVSRLIIITLAFSIVHILGRVRNFDQIFYQRFSTLKSKSKNQKLTPQLLTVIEEPKLSQNSNLPLSLDSSVFRIETKALFSGEILVYLKSLQKTHLLLIPLFVLQYLPRASDVNNWIFILALSAPLFLFSNTSFHLGDSFIRSTLAYKRPLFFTKALFLFTLLILYFSGTFINLLIVQKYLMIVSLLLGLLFSISLTASCSLVSKHLFSFIYMFLWYLGVMQEFILADLYGIHGNLMTPLIFGAIGIGLLIFAYKKF
ncbi:hypothetical protein [Paenibacillus etheri]|uniref:Uncharacterized protein n=1 Tax=Paenibacillus etheri TaxID=1306852 RepID=A0A0W1AVV8_9BACL|nr:hypothetical protein [Paenibacillus etheri]KTD85432.1 hypothetical protein UQ64_18130 [Paenibacillus etheri]